MNEKQYTKYTVDFRNVKHFSEVHTVIREGLDFPDYYGCNWDAFWDCITEPFGESVLIEILGIEVLEQFGDDAYMLLSTLKEWKEYELQLGSENRVEIVRGDQRIEIDDDPIETLYR